MAVNGSWAGSVSQLIRSAAMLAIRLRLAARRRFMRGGVNAGTRSERWLHAARVRSRPAFTPPAPDRDLGNVVS